MRMAADENFWWIGINFLTDRGVISSGITANVGNPYVHFLAKETIVQGKFISNLVVVYIPINCPQRAQCLDGVGYGKIAYISGMQNLICLLHIVENFIVNIAVGVAEK